MKKIIAIIMALVMMMAITAPAYATDISGNSTAQGSNGSAVVSTTYADTDWSYTVTIPADLEIGWKDKEEKDMSYTVTSQLLVGAQLKVMVTAKNGSVLSTTDGKTIPYIFTTTAEQTFAEVNYKAKNADGTTNNNTTVKVPSFDGYAVGNYTDTLTYTVTYFAPGATA